MNPINIRFKAKRLKDDKLIEGHYVQLHYSITETRSNGTIVKVGEEIRHHIYNDKFPDNEPHWQEIDPKTLEVFEITEQKSLFEEDFGKEVEE